MIGDKIMEMVGKRNDKVSVGLSIEDLKVLRNTLNEVLIELDHPGEFSSRIGKERELGVKLLEEIDRVFKESGNS